MSWQLHRAHMDDLDSLTPLFDGYRRFYEQVSDPERARTFLSERLQAADTVLFWAQHADGRGGGFTHLFPLWSSVRTGRLWLLNDLYVAPEARRQGVARLLMQQALDFAQADGALGVTLSTAKTNHQASALYRDMGFVLDQEFDSYEHSF